MKTIVLLVSLLFCIPCTGQNASEWTRQKKTQLQYLLNQIVANRMNLKHIRVGYEITQNGINKRIIIGRKDTSQHGKYFNSLLQVKRSVQDFSPTRDCVTLQLKFRKQLLGLKKYMDAANNLDKAIRDHCFTVIQSFENALQHSVDRLYRLLTSSYLQLNDAERMSEIETLYQQLQREFQFFLKHRNDIHALLQQSNQELLELQLSNKLND